MQRVFVDRTLEFKGDAANMANVVGNMSTERCILNQQFNGLALNATNDGTVYLDTNSTVAVGSSATAGPCLVLTSAATDTKTASYAAGGINLFCARKPVVEFKFKIDVITTVAIYAGFSDAASEATSLLPFGITTATLTDTCTDGAGFLFDTLQTLIYFNIVNTKNGTEAFTQLASTRVPVAGTFLTLRVALDASGNAYYYWNGDCVGVKASAVTTTVGYIPYFGIRNNSAAAHIANLKYVRAWCD